MSWFMPLMKPGKICNASLIGYVSLLRRFVSRSDKNGSVLLEALLSVVIMAVGLTAVMQSLTTSYKAALINKDYLQAIMLVENHLALVISGKDPEAVFNKHDDPEADERFEYEQTEKPEAFSTDKSLREIDLNVSWTTGHQKNQLLVTTLLFIPPDEEK